MNVLVACERFGVVREAFRALGHDAWSCDIVPEQGAYHGQHLEGDVRWFLSEAPNGQPWDLLIAHPDCTYLCSSGLHWNTKRPERAALTSAALDFVRLLMSAPIAHIAIENPIGRIGTAIRKADQIIQPYQFGHDASKRTGLWLRGLPHLQSFERDYIAPRMVNGKPRWANQTDSGQNRLGPSDTRAMERARTYQGIADAMAAQWSDYIVRQSR